MTLCFKACAELAETNPDYSFNQDDLPMLEEAFQRWLGLLEHKQITHGSDSYSLVFFPERVEAEIAGKMFEKPGQAWALASLAFIMLKMRAKEIFGLSGCLPLPKIDEALRLELIKHGIPVNGRKLPKFSLFTQSSSKQSCEFCCLFAECPQKTGF